MYCPQCGSESSSGQPYCRSCGANLKVIGKAVALSEAIARSDRGPLPKLKEMVKGLKVEHVTEEVSRALERMNKEIARSSPEGKLGKPWWLGVREKKTAEQRREDHFVKGSISFFSGIALTIFLYYFSAALILKLPPDWITRIPFELEPVVRVLWLWGLVPTLSGVGHMVAGLLIRPSSSRIIDANTHLQDSITAKPSLREVPGSITENTTDLLDAGGLNSKADG